jgi:hypothetical protein
MELLPAVDRGDSAESHELLMLCGGLALVTLGAGMLLTSPTVRKYLARFNVAGVLSAALPDVERYLKLRSM